MLSDTIDIDFDFQAHPHESTFHKQIQKMILQFQTELSEVCEHPRKHAMRVPKLDLLEVMCWPQSEMVNQARSLDLQTVQGRRQLFEIICRQQPENLWYSPECGPWGKFSNLNMGKSD